MWQLIQVLVRLVWSQAGPEFGFHQYLSSPFFVKGHKVRAPPFFVDYLGLYSVYGINIRPSESHRLLQCAAGRFRIGQNMSQGFNSNILYAIGEPGRNMGK